MQKRPVHISYVGLAGTRTKATEVKNMNAINRMYRASPLFMIGTVDLGRRYGEGYGAITTSKFGGS